MQGKGFSCFGCLMINFNMSSNVERKLAAIMFTDIVGYTAQMSKDEDKAFALIKKKRELLFPLLEKHEGIKHQCDLCEKSFTSKYYVKNHKKTAHCDSVEQSD